MDLSAHNICFLHSQTSLLHPDMNKRYPSDCPSQTFPSIRSPSTVWATEKTWITSDATTYGSSSIIDQSTLPPTFLLQINGFLGKFFITPSGQKEMQNRHGAMTWWWSSMASASHRENCAFCHPEQHDTQLWLSIPAITLSTSASSSGKIWISMPEQISSTCASSFTAFGSADSRCMARTKQSTRECKKRQRNLTFWIRVHFCHAARLHGWKKTQRILSQTTRRESDSDLLQKWQCRCGIWLRPRVLYPVSIYIVVHVVVFAVMDHSVKMRIHVKVRLSQVLVIKMVF